MSDQSGEPGPILALDLATNIGECLGTGVGLPRLSHKRLPSTGSDVGHFLIAFREWLTVRVERVWHEFGVPPIVVFEAPILARNATIEVTRKLHALPGVAEMVCIDIGRQGNTEIVCAQVIPSEAKKALTGSGGAKKNKMVEACRGYGMAPHAYVRDGMEQSDEADAFGVWIYALRQFRPQLQKQWAPLLFGRRLT